MHNLGLEQLAAALAAGHEAQLAADTWRQSEHLAARRADDLADEVKTLAQLVTEGHTAAQAQARRQCKLAACTAHAV